MCIGDSISLMIIIYILAFIIAIVLSTALVWVIGSLLLIGLKPELVRSDGSVNWGWTLIITVITAVIIRILVAIYAQMCHRRFEFKF